MKKEKGVDFSEIPKTLDLIEKEVGKVVVGQKEVVRDLFKAIICDGHVLLEGVPGIAKTLVLESLAKIMGCYSKRIQFTVDLLPSDISGITIFNQKTQDFEIVKGPIFTNFLLADEINRSPPKTQSALLEAMQERKVTIGRITYPLPRPFFVMATQNPIEHSGVYPLPEAQLDRFLFKLFMGYPEKEEEEKILETNVSINSFNDFDLKSVLDADRIISLQKKVKEVYCSPVVKRYIVDLVGETRSKSFSYSKYIAFGASPRASISLFIASKAEALINGRDYVVPEDVKKAAHKVLRHRIFLSFEADVDKISTDNVIDVLLKSVTAP